MPARMTRSDGAEMLTAAELQRRRKNHPDLVGTA